MTGRRPSLQLTMATPGSLIQSQILIQHRFEDGNLHFLHKQS